MSDLLYWFLFANGILMVLAAGFLLAIHAKHHRTFGSVRRAQVDRRWECIVLIPVALAVLAIVLVWGESARTLMLTGLAASVASLWFLHEMRGATLGSVGARIGWRSRRFEDFEEWRLTGDHARFRVAGQWYALELPVEDQSELRQQLVGLCPDRESRFKV